VTILDWAIIAFTLALALWGYRQGLIVGALTLVGFGVGAFLGSRLGPVVLSQGADSPYAPLCGAIGALLVGALSAVALEGIALALRRRLINHPFMHRADGAGGAALIGAVALGLAWIFGAVALHAPGTTQLRADVQNSVILRELDHVAHAFDRRFHRFHRERLGYRWQSLVFDRRHSVRVRGWHFPDNHGLGECQ